MGDSVPVRCPECLSTQAYAAPVFPCACGSPVAPPVAAGAVAEPITRRNWTDEWVTVRCGACGREDDWPHPELGCQCGAVLRVPVRTTDAAPSGDGAGNGDGAGAGGPGGSGGTGAGAASAGTGAGGAPGGPGGPGDSRGPGASGASGTAPHPGVVPPRAPDPGPVGFGTDFGGTDSGGTEPGGAGPGRTGPGGPAGADLGAPDRTGHDIPDQGLPGCDSPGHDVPDQHLPSRGTPGHGASGGRAPGDRASDPADPADPADPQGSDAPQDSGAPPHQGPYRPFAERYPAHIPLPPTGPRTAPARGAFRPVTIRTGRDAVAAAASYLRWLGFRDVVQPEERPASGVDLRAPGLVAQVDPSTRPAGLRAVECLWLNGLSASATSVFFSLAGYTPEARTRAAEIGLPLFVLDLTGTPQPVNHAADDLASGGA